MGRLSTLAFLLTLGAWGAATHGAPPNDAAPATSSPRPAAPVPPVRYLEAGARLFNSGQYGLAAKYLSAAQSYREQLSVSEQTVLDAYLKEMSRTPVDTSVAPASAAAPAPAPVEAAPAMSGPIGSPATEVSAPPSMGTSLPAPAQAPAPALGMPPAATDAQAAATAPAGDAKQAAKWKLQAAREQIRMGNYDKAGELVAEAQQMNVHWGLFDTTPAKVLDEIEKARPKQVAVAAPGQSRNHAAAKAKLKEARALLASNQFEQAEAIALDVKSWNLTYGVWEDSPDKLAAAARALRRRDTLRNGAPREQPSLGVYDVLVQQARHLMSTGEFDKAEAKALQAQRMNVVPSLTSDRAESVLHDLAMARARQAAPGTAGATVAAAESPSAAAERLANELLAKGNNAAAAAKFAEAEKLRAQESGQVALAAPATDSQILKVDNTAPDQGLPPVGDAPGLNAAAAPNALPPAAAPAGAPASDNRGEQLLAEARSLYSGGNYPGARQLVNQAKSGNHGVDAQADDLLAQIALAEQGGALSLYESALDALRKGESDRARALLTEVAASGAALDDGLMQKVQELLAKLPRDAAGKATATDLPQPAPDTSALAAQKLNAEVGTKIAEARRIQEVDPDKAIAIYESTLEAVKAKAPELSETVTRTMVRRLEVAIELAKKDKAVFDIKMKDKAQRAEIEQKRLRIFEADKAKKGRMKDLMDRATTAMAEGRYAEAEKFAKMAQEVDPNEVAASMLAWKANVQRHYKIDKENKAAKEEGALVAFQEVDLAAVATPEVQLNGIAYAKNFKDLTRERLRMNARLEIKKDPKTLQIEAKLNDPVSLNMDNQPLAEAIGFLANYTGLNIVLDPKALSDVDLTTASPVSLAVSNVKLKTALKLMLKPLGLNYKIEDEVLMITSPQASQDSTYAKPYYVGDLILPPRKPVTNGLHLQDEEAQMPTANPLANPGLAQPVGLGNGASTIMGSTPTVSAGRRPDVDFTPLIQLITATIAPGSWKVLDPGGGDVSGAYGMGGGFGADQGGVDVTTPIGSITPFFLSISLIVRHTAEIHEQVADLLRQLRRLQDLQVSIEVRFITLSDSFFEQIGVDFDFQINSNAVGKHSTFAIPNPLNPNNFLFQRPGALTGGIGGGGIGGGGIGGGGIGGGGIGGGGIGGGGGGIGGGGGGLGGAGGGLGGAGGGLGGQNAGGLGGLGGGGGGGIGGGGGVGGGTTGGGATSAAYIVNPIRDYSNFLPGGKQPITVGTSSGGIGAFSNNLAIPFTQNSASLIAPVNSSPGAGATFGLAFLSDLEVYLFLTAAQGDTRTNILQAPKVTTFNGASASIINTEMINFVSSLTPIVGPGSVAFLPSVQSFPNGVQLSVTPVVSADRRYVRMTLSPTFTVIEGFDTIQVPAAVGGSGLGGGSASINGTIQLPRFNFTTVSTTVTVPDGGTVLLGGVKRLNEERKEFGVPVLSKTPLLNRLFRNIGIGRQTSSLMLMVTPRIIILEEEENRLGIPTVAQ